MKRSRFRSGIWLAAILALLPGTVPAQEFGQNVFKSGPVAEDLYLAGEHVEVRGPVDGDVVAAGGRVVIEDKVSGDVIAAGGSVDIRADVADDVRAAGGEVTLSGQAAGDVLLAGGRVSLTEQAAAGTRAWLAGGDVEVAGRVGRELRVGGGNVVISGRVDGDALVYAQSLTLLPGAHITGTLTYHSPQKARIVAGAQVDGAILYQPVEQPGRAGERLLHGVAAVALLGLLILAIALHLTFPRVTLAAARLVGARPGVSLLLGLAVLFAVPPAAVLLMMTVVGVIPGLFVLALYALLLVCGLLTGVLSIADVALRYLRRGTETATAWRLVALAVTFFVLWLLSFVPAVHAVVLFLLLVFGVGALLIELERLYAASRRTPGPAAG